MKMRRKRSGNGGVAMDFLVGYISPRGEEMLVLWNGTTEVICRASDYEPVQEKRWEDVTEHIHVHENGRALYWGSPLLPEGYRFVKANNTHVLTIEREVAG